MENKFPIGFWLYQDVPLSDIKKWADCGLTLAQSPRYGINEDSLVHLREFLDECEKYDIKVLVCSGSFDFRAAIRDENECRKCFSMAYSALGSHPALYGFSLGDEPCSESELQGTAIAHRIQKEIAPEFEPFVNFVPDGKLPAKLLSENRFDNIGFDCYTQMIEGSGDSYFNHFFSTFRMFRLTNHGRGKLTVTPLSVGHNNYRVPSEDDLRWQLNASVACGADAVMWFTLYSFVDEDNYRLSPFDGFGNETPTFYAMRRVLKTFNAMHADHISRLTHADTWMTTRAYAEYTLYESGTITNLLGMESKTPGIISKFVDDNGGEYAMIVNNSPFVNDKFTLVLDEKVTNVTRLSCSETNYNRKLRRNGGKTTLDLWLAPGQMEILQFE